MQQSETHTKASREPALPSHEEIAALAYSYWQQREGENGTPEDDWSRAEQQLRQATR